MKRLNILLAVITLCLAVAVDASPDPKTPVTDSLPSLERWKILRKSDTSVHIWQHRTGESEGRRPSFSVRKLVNITRETSDSKAVYRLNYDLTNTSRYIYDRDAKLVRVHRDATIAITSLRRLSGDTLSIVIAADPIRFFIPYHGYSVKATAKSIPNTSFQLLSEQYEIHANTYNQFRRMYQRAYIRQGFIPIAFTANITPLAAYRANFINEAQFTHAPEQQARAADERATYSTAVEAHIGLALRNHMPYVSFLHLRSGFKTENSAQIDWKTGLSNGSDAGTQRHLFYQNGFGLGYYVSGYGKRLFNACFDGELYYLWVSQSKIHGSERDVVTKGAAHIRDLGLRPHQFGAKLAAGISLRPNYALDFHVMPTLYCNISSISKASILRTNLVSYGLTVGFTYRLMKPSYKDPVWYRRR